MFGCLRMRKKLCLTIICVLLPIISLLFLVMGTTNALQLKHIPRTNNNRFRLFAPRRYYYRILDQDEEHAQKRVRMRKTFLWKRRKTKQQKDNTTIQQSTTTDDEASQVEILTKNNGALEQQQQQQQDVQQQQRQQQQQQQTKERSNNKNRINEPYVVVTNAQELRTAILDEGRELQDIENAAVESSLQVKDLLNHDVIQLISNRFATKSTPGNRDDTAKLALSMEGGGMRGAVSAGMAAAIACLGLCDAFDVIYGSSAGSVVGAYMVSRQMCVDVYTDVLPAAQAKFVCKKRLIKSLATSALDLLLKQLFPPKLIGEKKTTAASPGMNISFVLDGIMGEDHGLRPLDMESFRANDAKQPLRVAASAVHDDKLEMVCFGSKDFFGDGAAKELDGRRTGLFACLDAGMTVPGATGPPVNLVLPNKENNSTITKACFDAFCFEPLPYRSAVEEGATHVLVLRSRPEGFQARTKQGVYEKAVTPLYFQTHDQPDVAEFFDKGGQQYIYLEDLLTLEEGRNAGITNKNSGGIHVPPTNILYGIKEDDEVKSIASNRQSWRKAHILPVLVPKGTKELSTLEQDKNEVVTAVRGGFAAAFDLLAPAIGLDPDSADMLTGERVAELVFPLVNVTNEAILANKVPVNGNPIVEANSEQPPKKRLPRKKVGALFNLIRRVAQQSRTSQDPPPIDNVSLRQANTFGERSVVTPPYDGERCHRQDAKSLLKLLPGIQPGQLPYLAEGLLYTQEQTKI